MPSSLTAVVVAFTVYSINSKAIGLKVLQPVALSTAPLVIVHCLGCIAVVGEDYCCSLADTAYFAYLLVSHLQALAYTALVTFTQVNAGLAAALISLKVFISVTMIVGNIIHVYLLSLIVVLLSSCLCLVLAGLSLTSYLLYLFLTELEFFLYILFLLEAFSNLFQSLTLANRLSINLMAGSLLTFLLANSLNAFALSSCFCIALLVLTLLSLVFAFELFNCIIQLFIFMLLSLNFMQQLN